MHARVFALANYPSSLQCKIITVISQSAYDVNDRKSGYR